MWRIGNSLWIDGFMEGNRWILMEGNVIGWWGEMIMLGNT